MHEFTEKDLPNRNPPYGANIDSQTALFEKLYPRTSHGYKDIYKYFFEQGLNLLKINGILCYITPNTFLRQPRYSDLRCVLMGKQITQILDLGENVFENAIVPVAVAIVKNEADSYYANDNVYCLSQIPLRG